MIQKVKYIHPTTVVYSGIINIVVFQALGLIIMIQTIAMSRVPKCQQIFIDIIKPYMLRWVFIVPTQTIEITNKMLIKEQLSTITMKKHLETIF